MCTIYIYIYGNIYLYNCILYIQLHTIVIMIIINNYIYTYALYIYIYIYLYGIHHWKILWSSYRKLAWVGYEPTATEFCSAALTDWGIRPWV